MTRLVTKILLYPFVIVGILMGMIFAAFNIGLMCGTYYVERDE